MWRHIAQSLQGPSHLADGTCCQDFHGVKVLGQKTESVLVACVADGAGSARFSQFGSKTACESLLELASAHFNSNGHFDGFSREDAIGWCEDIHTRIKSAAAEMDCTARELATTLSAVIATPNSSSFFQIGDGGIVVRHNGVCGIVFWPQSGEYANSTNFITSDDYRDQLEFVSVDSSFGEIALMTDGLERLALSFNQHIPHAPFFEPLFRALRTAENLTQLGEDLRIFLGSTSVQQRSDDDKTIILASRDNTHDAA